MSISNVLIELSERCANLESRFPGYQLVLTQTRIDWSWDPLQDRDSQGEIAFEALYDIAGWTVRILHRHGATFESSMGNVRASYDEPNGWFRLLLSAFGYIDAEDILDLPTTVSARQLQGNPFTLSRMLLLEIAGLIDDGEKISAIMHRINQEPSWPRYEELDWGDDATPVAGTEQDSKRGFSDRELEIVREIIKGKPTLKYASIRQTLRQRHGTGMGMDKLTAILDHIRENHPAEYKVPTRARKS